MQLALATGKPHWESDKPASPLGWLASLVIHIALAILVLYFPVSHLLPPTQTSNKVYLIDADSIVRPKPEPVPIPRPRTPEPTAAPAQPAKPQPKPVPKPVPKPIPKPVTRSATKPPDIVTESAPPLVNPQDAQTVTQPLTKPANREALEKSQPTGEVREPLPRSVPVVTQARVDAKYANDNPTPVYPAMARRLGQEGAVTLRVMVDPQGKALSVDIEKSSGFPLLDNAAKQAIMQWKFVAATRDGQPITQSLTTQWVYKLSNR